MVGSQPKAADLLLALALAGALVAVVFLTTGGTDLVPNTWVEIALTVIGAGTAGAVVLAGGRDRRSGGVVLLLFGALAALTYASIAWSVAPDASWVEANRTLSYLSVFGLGIAFARLAPDRWPAIVGAVALAATSALGLGCRAPGTGTSTPAKCINRNGGAGSRSASSKGA